MADITNKNIGIPGVNTATNYIQQRAFVLDFGVNSEVAATGTHSLIDIPADEALVGLKVIVEEAVTSGGTATATFKLKTASINATALSISGLAAGMVHNFSVAGIAGYDKDNVLNLTVASAALTGGKILLITETIPAAMMLTNG